MNSSPAAAALALSRHREVFARTRSAVAEWAAGSNRSRVEVAESVVELLAPCARDTTGDLTLDAVSDVFEEHDHMLPRSVVVQLQALVSAAHALGQSRERDEPSKLPPASHATTAHMVADRCRPSCEVCGEHSHETAKCPERRQMATKWLDEAHGIMHPQWIRLRGYDVLQLGAADYVLDGSGGLLSVNGDSHNEWNAIPFGVRWALTADDIAAGHYGSARLDGLAVAEFRKRGLLKAAE